MADDLLTRARDAGYTAIGFGVLALQRAQVRRRELTPTVKRLARQAEVAVDPVLDSVERALPDGPRRTLRRARRVGRAVESVLLG